METDGRIWRGAARAGAVAQRARSRLAGRPVRPLHPDGRSFTAEVTVGRSGRPWGTAFLDRPGRYSAIARVSKSAGTPPGWPDVLGLALRIELDGGPFDLLLSTVGRAPAVRHLPLPRRTFTAAYGSILSYRGGTAAGRRIFLAALPEPDRTALGRTLDDVGRAAGHPAGRLLLTAASASGRWRPYGTLTLEAPLPADADADLAFDPSVRHPADLLPVGLLHGLRGVVYRGAQRARAAALRQRPDRLATGGPPRER